MNERQNPPLKPLLSYWIIGRSYPPARLAAERQFKAEKQNIPACPQRLTQKSQSAGFIPAHPASDCRKVKTRLKSSLPPGILNG